MATAEDRAIEAIMDRFGVIEKSLLDGRADAELDRLLVDLAALEGSVTSEGRARIERFKTSFQRAIGVEMDKVANRPGTPSRDHVRLLLGLVKVLYDHEIIDKASRDTLNYDLHCLVL
jgi:hypothetical protein